MAPLVVVEPPCGSGALLIWGETRVTATAGKSGQSLLIRAKGLRISPGPQLLLAKFIYRSLETDLSIYRLCEIDDDIKGGCISLGPQLLEQGSGCYFNLAV